LITPTFHFTVLEDFCDVFSENANILINELDKTSSDGKVINIYPFITNAALDIICGKYNKMIYPMQICAMSKLRFIFHTLNEYKKFNTYASAAAL
jgi:hypothetical protein